MLLERESSCLILIDAQEKLIPLVHDSATLIRCCQRMLDVATRLNIPRLVTEQYPKGLGKTVPALASYFQETESSEKLHFSCAADRATLEKIKGLKRQQIVLMGIEAHICVLQTALELKKLGFDVFVIAEAVSAAHLTDLHYALRRMEAAGVSLVSAQMVVFEWLHCAGTPEFKEVTQAFFKG